MVGLGTQQIVIMLGLFHMRCRNARKCNHQLLFLHGRIQSLLAHQSDVHVIIKSRDGRMFNPSLQGENIDAQAASTDRRATLYMDDEIHMFGKDVIKKQRGGLNKKNLFFFLPKAVFEYVYFSTGFGIVRKR